MGEIKMGQKSASVEGRKKPTPNHWAKITLYTVRIINLNKEFPLEVWHRDLHTYIYNMSKITGTIAPTQ